MKRRARQEQAAFGIKAQQRLPALRAKVFDVMCFVEDEVYPWLAPKNVLICQHKLVRRDAHVKAVGCVPTYTLRFALFLRTVVRKDFETRQELFELHLPVEHHTRGCHDQVGTPVATIACEMREQCDGLNCLAQSHFVR